MYFDEADKQPHSLHVKNSVFISFYWTAEKYGVGLVVKNDSVNEATLNSARQKLSQLTRLKLNLCEAKVVGTQAPVEAVRLLFNQSRLPKPIETIRQAVDFQLIYYPDTGRIRIEKETMIRTLIVDDSATIRKLLTSVLGEDPAIQTHAVGLPSQVEEAIKTFQPHVITLDIHMPEMDGVTLLKKILPRYHIPTIMITSVSKEEGTSVLEALEVGAIDYIQKPTMAEIKNVSALICEKVKMAAQAKKKSASKNAVIVPSSRPVNFSSFTNDTLIAIGSSTGGTEALREVLIRLPKEIPPIVITQHIPAVFSAALAKRLNELCPFTVKEAEDGDPIVKGQVLIAPGGKQFRVAKNREGKLFAKVTEDGPVNRHCPSVDVLFDSVSAEVGSSAIGVILTGMGADGAKGLLRMKQAGSLTIAQDEESCVVFGMPKEAIKLGAATDVVSLQGIPEKLSIYLFKAVKKERKKVS